ncbi:hypothetical protein M407DRAFT_244182 [Tulasnella calospora MUT 4182]|uniref:Uncharacterized protein n=1 Tax=Tulasnella calospora MUT 4182 TaxID=1051891 RepID=A0A0C3Q6V6_9AGAM|nr:hypothetical protein M407DRAFT_244182 [Tulasnella calospora MUT 4182]
MGQSNDDSERADAYNQVNNDTQVRVSSERLYEVKGLDSINREEVKRDAEQQVYQRVEDEH